MKDIKLGGSFFCPNCQCTHSSAHTCKEIQEMRERHAEFWANLRDTTEENRMARWILNLLEKAFKDGFDSLTLEEQEIIQNEFRSMDRETLNLTREFLVALFSPEIFSRDDFLKYSLEIYPFIEDALKNNKLPEGFN